jgi:hypothetical protein
MSLLSLPAGAYSLTWNNTSLGLLEGQPRMVDRPDGIDHKAHLFGSNTIEVVDTGIDSLYVLFTIKEWTAATKSLLWPFGTMGTAGLPFRVASDYRFFPLVLTAEPGSAAATLGPVTRTFPLCGLALRQNRDMALGGPDRNVSIVMQALAVPASGGSHSSVYFLDT